MGSIWRLNQRPKHPGPQGLISGSKCHPARLRWTRLHARPRHSKQPPLTTALDSSVVTCLDSIATDCYSKRSLSHKRWSTERHRVLLRLLVQSAVFGQNQTIYIHIVQNTVISMRRWEPFSAPAPQSASTANTAFLSVNYRAAKNKPETRSERSCIIFGSLIVFK